MHDFGAIDLKGKKAVLKARNYYKKPHFSEYSHSPANIKASEAETLKGRTLTIVSGPGCQADPAWGRRIEVKLPDGSCETISSYDLEYVIGPNGLHLTPIEASCNMDDIAYVCK